MFNGLGRFLFGRLGRVTRLIVAPVKRQKSDLLTFYSQKLGEEVSQC